MRIEGTLAKWNDDRGFGFIARAQGGPEIFVHVSVFPHDGLRPKVGERLSFEIEADRNGKTRATNLVCLDRQVRHAARRDVPPGRREKRSVFAGLIQLVVVLALVAYGYSEYSRRAAHKAQISAAETQAIEQPASANFQCDGRTFCSQMSSCAEAMYFLKHCPNVKMDGNHDGIPCERQWCN